jgi:hypothetical protein
MQFVDLASVVPAAPVSHRTTQIFALLIDDIALRAATRQHAFSNMSTEALVAHYRILSLDANTCVVLGLQFHRHVAEAAGSCTTHWHWPDVCTAETLQSVVTRKQRAPCVSTAGAGSRDGGPPIRSAGWQWPRLLDSVPARDSLHEFVRLLAEHGSVQALSCSPSPASTFQ